ncbi:MAG: hypothetical protein RLZ98_2390, partial [Pseudomonadota bacterium]
KLLAVFSVVALVAIAASLVVHPFGGMSAALTACWLVLAAFALSLYICDRHLKRVWPAETGSAQDQIERLKDETWSLRESEARYRELLDAQSDVICRRNRKGELTFVNRAYCRKFGVEPDHCLGTRFQPASVLPSPDEAAAAAGFGVAEPLLFETPAGQRWFAFERHSVRGGEIEEVGRDITVELEKAEALAEARDQALSADRAKSRFLATMSHEIRTPMNGILGMTGLLLETTQTPEQVNYCHAIDQSARTLLGLIDEILDFSKIEAGRLELRNEPFALHSAIQSAVELLAPKAHEKGLEIAFTLDPELPGMVVGDKARVRQVLLNLIGNALRFTDRGGVLVNCSVLANSGQQARVSIQVKDTGVGIEASALDGIFGEFDQGATPVHARRGGTGLGLAISRRLALAMGGDITVVSAPGRGATFTVELELGVVEGARPLRTRAEGMKLARHALLAFDRAIERRSLAQNLRSFGISVTEANSPSDLGAIRSASETGQPVDLVIVDAEGDPLSAGACLAALRERASGQPVRGVILVNALARASLGQFRAQGFSSYLVRPVLAATLPAQLSATRGDGALADEVQHQSALPVPENERRLNVLLAEDNEINALLARRLLEKMGCSLVHARDGQQAVDAVRRSLEGLACEFDIVLMDMQMPLMDGFEATATIRALKEGSGAVRLPAIVAVTANAFEEDRKRCLDAGLDDYLAKPFERADLERLILRWCSSRTAA